MRRIVALALLLASLAMFATGRPTPALEPTPDDEFDRSSAHDATTREAPIPRASAVFERSLDEIAWTPPVHVPSQGRLRETQRVTVNGVSEEWRLEWAHDPRVLDTMELTWCGSSGYAWAEQGELELVRVRPGVPDERLPLRLGELGGQCRDDECREMILQRWPVAMSDFEHIGKAPANLPARRVVQAMRFADFDHDGHATEFSLQVGATPCGHHPTVIVGVSSVEPRLHAFHAVGVRAPLVFESRRDVAELSRNDDFEVVQYQCGDHGTGLGECFGDPRGLPSKDGSYCTYPNHTFHLHADGELHVKDTSVNCGSMFAMGKGARYGGRDDWF